MFDSGVDDPSLTDGQFLNIGPAYRKVKVYELSDAVQNDTFSNTFGWSLEQSCKVCVYKAQSHPQTSPHVLHYHNYVLNTVFRYLCFLTGSSLN